MPELNTRELDVPLFTREYEESRAARVLRETTFDILLTLAVSVVLAAIAAFLWWQLTPLAEFTRVDQGGQMLEAQLAKEIDADGWFFVVTAVGGMISGLVLGWLCRRDPVLTTVLIALGGLLAAYLTGVFGLEFGPADPNTVLPTAAVGTQVPVQLTYEAKGLLVVWPITALGAALALLWGLERD